MLSLFYLIVIILIFSFLCSLAEAALLSVPLLRVRIMVKQKRPGALDLLYIKENMALAVASLVVLNNTINIMGSMLIGQQVSIIYGSQWLGVASGVLTLLIIVLGEVIPKTIGERLKNPVSLGVAKVVRTFMLFLTPFVKATNYMVKFITPDPKATKVTEEEIKILLEIGRDSGTVETDEAELCKKVFRLKDLRAGDIMKPLKDAFMLESHTPLSEIKDRIINSPYSRIVVYHQNPSHIVGIVQQRILLREMARDNHESKVSDWMLKPIFVNRMIKLDALMEKFLNFNQHLFIVKDNLGKIIGLVTMEDVLEELFGEIFDEKDVREKHASKKI